MSSWIPPLLLGAALMGMCAGSSGCRNLDRYSLATTGAVHAQLVDTSGRQVTGTLGILDSTLAVSWASNGCMLTGVPPGQWQVSASSGAATGVPDDIIDGVVVLVGATTELGTMARSS
jgi:hypothetical protein